MRQMYLPEPLSTAVLIEQPKSSRIVYHRRGKEIIDSFRFCENIEKDHLRRLGKQCGLTTGDWARSTRWVNLPDLPKNTNREVCESPIADPC